MQWYTKIVEIIVYGGRWVCTRSMELLFWAMVLGVFYLATAQFRVVECQGSVMGVRYVVQYRDPWGKRYDQELERLLSDIEQSLSSSLYYAELARFNKHGCSAFRMSTRHFYPLLAKSKEVYRNTEGVFDPTAYLLSIFWKGKHPPLQEKDIQKLEK